MRFKYIIPLLLFCTCFSITPGIAQVRIGPSLGFNISKFSDPVSTGEYVDVRRIESVNALKAGCMLEYAPGLKLSLQTGLFYSGMGSDFDLFYRDYGETERVKVRLNYISIPLEGHYALKNGSSKISVYTGLDFNILAIATEGGFEDSESFSRFDPMIKLGGQIILTPGIGFRIDYGFGTSNVFKPVSWDKDEISGLENKNRTIGVSILWLFGGAGVI